MSKKNNGRIENDSWFIPFEMPGDSFFDHNHDGKLTGWETLQRDAYHYEMSQKFEEAKKNDKPSYSGNYKGNYNCVNRSDKPKKAEPKETRSAGITLLAIFSAIFILIFLRSSHLIQMASSRNFRYLRAVYLLAYIY